MGHALRGVIGPEDAVRFVAKHVGCPSVALVGRWFLLPWTEADFERCGPSDEALEPPGLLVCHSRLAEGASDASDGAALAYIETDSFGGVVEQGAAVFRDGEIDWLSPFGLISPHVARSVVSEALSRIGVRVAASEIDEFDSLGLGRHRRTEEWRSGKA